MSEEEISAALDRALAAPRSAAKIRVTMWLDLDIYDALINEAGRDGKYQTLMNKYLRAAVLKEVSSVDLKALKIALGA